MISKILENKELEEQIAWMRQETNYGKLTNQDIQEENRKVLLALKNLEGRLDKELEQQKYSRISHNSQEQITDPLKIVQESIKNNENLIKVLEKEVKKLRERREELKEGL
jgi:hypothetical protein